MIISKRTIKKSLKEPAYAISVFKKRIFSQLSYHFFNGYSNYPETLSLFLTYNCNLRCRMCGYWGKCGSMKQESPEFLREELSMAELEKLIAEVSAFKPNITLFGGEPLLYRHWPDLVSYIKGKWLRCNVVTNGTILKDKALEVINSGLDEIIFSLEGPRHIHDEITQVSGSFDMAIEGLRQINVEKKRRSIKSPRINIACTISEDNFRLLNEIIEIAASIGADSITFHHLCFINNDILARHNQIFKEYFNIKSSDWSGFVRGQLPNIDIEYFIEEIKRIDKSKFPIGVFFYPNFSDDEIKRYYSDFEFTPSSYKNRCLSPWMTAYIFPDGTVRPCEELDFSCGNVKEQSFRQIWNNATYRNFRKIVKKIKVFPVCSKCTELYRF
ncbi:MAG: radical SAM protein [Candidatus Omnitrophota bacterium]